MWWQFCGVGVGIIGHLLGDFLVGVELGVVFLHFVVERLWAVIGGAEGDLIIREGSE